MARESRKARLQALAGALRATLASSSLRPQQAYSALLVDGEIHPWTQEAQRIWEQDGGFDEWHDHHLAVLYHSRAYDSETEQSDEAFEYWARALTCWRRVLDDEGFWQRMADHLASDVGMDVEPHVIKSVRARLPEDLLAPHVTLVTEYRASNSKRAREHLDLIKGSGFDRELIDTLRFSLVKDVINEVPEAARTGNFKEMAVELRSWLAVDPDNPHLLQGFLHLYRRENERILGDPDWSEQVSRNLAEVQHVIGDALKAMVEPGAALRVELSRRECWLGMLAYEQAANLYNKSPSVVKECEAKAELAVDHFQEAKRLDPGIALDGWYEVDEGWECFAQQLWGMCRREMIGPYGVGDLVGAVQHLRTAVKLNPNRFYLLYWLAKSLLDHVESGSGRVRRGDREILEAAEVIARAGPLATDAEKRQDLGELTVRYRQLAVPS